MASPARYLMESDTEGDRLLRKSDAASTRAQLISTGLGTVGGRGCRIVDAGSGSGFVAGIAADVLAEHGCPSAEIVLLDSSEPRLRAAKDHLAKSKKYGFSFVPCSLDAIPLDDASVDYVFCRFVFEYLPRPEKSLDELIRILRPGGRLVVGDLDYNCLSHYPLEPDLESQLNELASVLTKEGLIDPLIGRKLFTWFLRRGLQNLHIQVIPHHLIYGALTERDRQNWTAKINQLTHLSKKGDFQLTFDVDRFRKRFLAFFESEERFSYTPLILVHGDKS